MALTAKLWRKKARLWAEGTQVKGTGLERVCGAQKEMNVGRGQGINQGKQMGPSAKFPWKVEI